MGVGFGYNKEEMKKSFILLKLVSANCLIFYKYNHLLCYYFETKDN